MRKLHLLLILAFVFSISVSAQFNRYENSVFFGGMAGAAKFSASGTEDQNPLSFVVGGSFGIPIPVVEDLYLYLRTAYTSQSNFQSFYNTSYLNYNVNFSNEFVEVNSTFTQLILNGGLLYNFLVTEEYTLGVNGGLTFMILNQEARLRTGVVISSVENENIWGAFGGVIGEKRWEDSNFSTFMEIQYNYAESDAVYRPGALSAMNYTFGARYYLTGR